MNYPADKEKRELPRRIAEDVPPFHRAGGDTCIRVRTIDTVVCLPKEA
jgi:hypothetical protein